jgi:NTE family protein
LLSASCAALTTSDTHPLPPDKLEPPGSVRISRDGYRLEALKPTSGTADLLVLVAMSGGGKRSASFGYGVLKGMRDMVVTTAHGSHPLLQDVSVISGVSGGSFPAAYYGLYRDAAFGKFEEDFLYQYTNSYIYGIYLLPWHWGWQVDPAVGTNDYMAHVYDQTMFHGATFGDLRARGRPLIAIGATDLSYGTPFLFTQEIFDLICSDLDSFPIARAVAASNGFPGLFSPITLTNHAKDCGGRRPGWLAGIPVAERDDPLSRNGAAAREAERYVDAEKARYLHLVDGGVADNLGLRVGGALMQSITLREVRERGFERVRRILVISVDGEGAQDTSLAQQRHVGGLLSLVLQASGAQIDRYNLETLIAVTDQIQKFAKTIATERCVAAAVFDGSRCDDVKGQLVHISLAEMPPGPVKTKLLAIPTGLSVKREDVDLLIDAGHEAIVGSTAVQEFLADYAHPTRPPAQLVHRK